MSYQINHTDSANYPPITVEDQTINQETSLGFVGKNYTGYSAVLAENFLHLLENFAKSTAPSNPQVGQLWYDTNLISDPAQPQLKVWDGTTWTAAGNVKKSTSQPLAANSVVGDLWVDTANQQLSLWSGSSWILVGPQFSEGTQTGPKVESIVDTLNTTHTIIKLVVADENVAIISKDAFTPKAVIAGFESIKQGINISTKDFDGNGTMLNKYWGTAEKADALLVGNTAVAASNFLRNDTSNVTNYGISIRSNSGLTIGTDLNTLLTTTTVGETVLYNKTEGSSIFVRVFQNNAAKDVITVSGTNVGINKTNPTVEFDVTGKIQVSDILTVTSTDAATSTTGSIKTLGGISVAKNMSIGTTLSVTGSAATGALTVAGNISTSGNISATNISATNIQGTFVGQLSGSVTGSASRLTSPTVFQLAGDITSNAISFTGQQVGGTATFTTILSSDFISTKTSALDSFITDELIINRIGTGLRKINKQTFLSNVATVPTGAIFPFAGTVVPTGYILCDGAEQLIANYPELFTVIGYTYKALGLLEGISTFAVPDLRGRFPLGKDSMNNGTSVPSIIDGSLITTIDPAADRVTDVTADTVGLSNGNEEKDIGVTNLPDHKHDLKGTDTAGGKGDQYYAIRNSPDPITDVDAVPHTGNGPDAAGTGQYLTNSGGVQTTGSLGIPVNIMNPYLTINYIIFTGRII
jgi:microcystin-dependent protein